MLWRRKDSPRSKLIEIKSRHLETISIPLSPFSLSLSITHTHKTRRYQFLITSIPVAIDFPLKTPSSSFLDISSIFHRFIIETRDREEKT